MAGDREKLHQLSTKPSGAEAIRAQIKATEEFGSDGWMLWNPRNVYSGDGLRKR